LLVVAFIEDAIEAHGAHVHIADLGPAEELVVEVESGVEVGGVELVPADGAGSGRRGALGRGHGRVAVKTTMAAPCGSDMTAKRSIPGTSVAGLHSLPPASTIFSMCASTSSTEM
jgi:hypothetical protein